MASLVKMVEFVREHGIEASAVGDCVVVVIQFAFTDEVERVECRTWGEIKAALGY